MAISVTCPSCLKRFNVSDKFAGKSGPCPNCQKQIKIPEKSEEVVIHAPEDDAPKDSKGRSILKPIRRQEVKLGLPVILVASLSGLVVFGIALGLGLSGGSPPTALLAVSSLLLAPPLVFVGYWFLHDDELEGFNGRQLLLRCGVCSIAFAFLWLVYASVPRYVSGYASMAEFTGFDLIIVIPVMLVIGTVVSVAILELEVFQGALHYGLYLGVTFVLAWLAGTELAGPLGGESPGLDETPPGLASPSGDDPEAKPAPPEQPEQKKVPKLLQ